MEVNIRRQQISARKLEKAKIYSRSNHLSLSLKPDHPDRELRFYKIIRYFQPISVQTWQVFQNIARGSRIHSERSHEAKFSSRAVSTYISKFSTVSCLNTTNLKCISLFNQFEIKLFNQSRASNLKFKRIC